MRHKWVARLLAAAFTASVLLRPGGMALAAEGQALPDAVPYQESVGEAAETDAVQPESQGGIGSEEQDASDAVPYQELPEGTSGADTALTEGQGGTGPEEQGIQDSASYVESTEDAGAEAAGSETDGAGSQEEGTVPENPAAEEAESGANPEEGGTAPSEAENGTESGEWGEGLLPEEGSQSIEEEGLPAAYAEGDSAEEMEEIHVSTTEELKAAVGSYKRILLADGIYEIDAPLRLNHLQALTIQAENFGKAEVLSHERYSPVVSLYSCSDIEISGCILGHDAAEMDCGEEGVVIYAESSTGIRIGNCDLYGCGTKGLQSWGSQNVSVSNCMIRDCMYNVAELYSESDAGFQFINCVISGNCYTKYSNAAFVAYGSSNPFYIENCTFLNNYNDRFVNENQPDPEVINCTFHDNVWDGQTPKEYGVCLNGLTWQIDGDTLKLGFPLQFEDGSVIESAQVEPLSYSDSSLPWKRCSYQNVVKAWGQEEPGDSEPVPLSPAVQDAPYDAALPNEGGQKSYALAEGALPEGLTLTADGKINGVPKEAGTFSFAVQVTDNSDGSLQTEKYSLEVNADTNGSEDQGTGDLIASGSHGDIVWSIDANGKLTVSGTGDYAASYVDVSQRSPWYEYREQIVSAEVSVTGITDAMGMFYGCHNLASVDLSKLDTSNVTSMFDMFFECSSLSRLDLGNFDTQNVTSMCQMFWDCSGLTELDLGNFNTRNVQDMSSLFSGCSSLKKLDLSSFDTQNVTNMLQMFLGCSGLTELDLGNFNTGNVQDMMSMFRGCTSLERLDLSSFDTQNVTNMCQMFDVCSGLTDLDLRNFDVSNVPDLEIFRDCDSLQTLYTPKAMGDKTITLPATYSDPQGNRTNEITSSFANTVLTKAEELRDHIVSSDYGEIKEALASEEVKLIDYVLPDGQNVPYEEQNEIFAALQGGDKSMSFVFQDETGNEVYRWTFAGSEITDPGRTVDFQIIIDAKNPAVLALTPADVEKVDLDFRNEGVLPGRANIRVAAGSYFEADKLYLYYYNPESDVLELVDDNVMFDGNFASFYLDHNSNYVLTAAMLRTLLPETPQETPKPQTPADNQGGNSGTQSGSSAAGQERTNVLNGEVLQYIVVKGDTLGKIARMHHTTVTQLVSLNPAIKNPNRIYIGQVIIVDGSVQVPEESKSTLAEIEDYYIVRKGDSFYKISRKYGIPLKKLLELNPDLGGQRYIFPGQMVFLKQRGSEQ